MVIGFNFMMETFSIALGNVLFAQTSQCRDSSVRLWRVCGRFFCPLIFCNSARGGVNYMACWLRSSALALIGRFRVISLGWQYEELTWKCWISQRKRWWCLQSHSSPVWELPRGTFQIIITNATACLGRANYYVFIRCFHFFSQDG